MKTAALLLVLYILSVNAFSQAKTFIDQPYLETKAEVDTLVNPDRIHLSIQLSEKDTKGKSSVEDLENKMASKLKSIGIDLEKQLKVADVTSNFGKYFLKQQDILKSKAYTLVVYDAKTAASVVVGLEDIGISNVDLTTTEYSKMDELKIALKTKAIIKAKNQAEAMVKPLNQKLGKAIFISDTHTRVNNQLQGRVAGVQIAYGTSLAEKRANIEFEKIKVYSDVNITFKLE